MGGCERRIEGVITSNYKLQRKLRPSHPKKNIGCLHNTQHAFYGRIPSVNYYYNTLVTKIAETTTD